MLEPFGIARKRSSDRFVFWDLHRGEPYLNFQGRTLRILYTNL